MGRVKGEKAAFNGRGVGWGYMDRRYWAGRKNWNRSKYAFVEVPCEVPDMRDARRPR